MARQAGMAHGSCSTRRLTDVRISQAWITGPPDKRTLCLSSLSLWSVATVPHEPSAEVTRAAAAQPDQVTPETRLLFVFGERCGMQYPHL